MEQLYFEKLHKEWPIKPNATNAVEEYQAKHQIRLPEAYVEFISRLGDLHLWLWLGQTMIRCDFREIDVVIDKAHNCLREVQANIGEFFPFAIDHADYFWFFRLNEGDNPAVYYFDSAVYDAKFQEALVLEIPMEPVAASTGLPHGMTKVTDTFTEFIYFFAERDKTLKLD